MALTLEDLVADISQVDAETLLSDWAWLIGQNRAPVLVTAMGNAFLEDRDDGSVWLLDAGTGKTEQVAGSVTELNEQLMSPAFVMERLLVDDFVAAREVLGSVQPGQVYGYKTPPVLGGGFDTSNLEVADVAVHFSVLGQIHRQVKDLPYGAPVSGIAAG